MAKDKSKENGGISEAELSFAQSQKPPSKAESIAEAAADMLSMGSASKTRKARENKEREEYVRHWEHR